MLGIVVQNFEEILYERMETRLPLGADDLNSGSFSDYVHGNATPLTL